MKKFVDGLRDDIAEPFNRVNFVGCEAVCGVKIIDEEEFMKLLAMT